MPKIPTFQAEGSIEQLAGTTSNIKINPDANIFSALQPVTDFVVKQKIKENDIQNRTESLKLENDYITEANLISEHINQDKTLSINKEAANAYLKERTNALIEKFATQATNKNSETMFRNSALGEVQKQIFSINTDISNNILVQADAIYNEKKEKIVSRAFLKGGIYKETLEQDLENLTIDTFKNRVTYPELQKILKSIPGEIQTYEAIEMVQRTPRKAYYFLKDDKNFPDIDYDKRQKLKEKAAIVIRSQITTEWKNYTDTVAAGKEPPYFDMKLAVEVMGSYVGEKMLQEESLTKDRVTNNAVINNASIATENEVVQGYIDEGYEMFGEAVAAANEKYYRNILSTKQTAMKKDPVDFIIKINPDIEALYEEMKNDDNADSLAATRKIFTEKVIQQQKDMGISNSAIRITKKSEIEEIKKTLTNTDTPYLEKKAFINGLSIIYGKENMSKVLNHLQAEKLPVEYIVAISTNSDSLTEDILSGENIEDLKKIVSTRLDSTKKFNSIEKEVAKGMANWEEVILAQGEGSVVKTKYILSVQAAIYKAALQRIKRGDSVSDAVDSAVSDFTRDYYIPPQAIKTWMIPVDVNGVRTNRWVIEEKAEAILFETESKDSNYLDKFHGADGYMHYAKFAGIENLTEEQAKDRITSTIRNHSKWLLNADSTGIILNAEFANGTYPIVNANGQKIEFFFTDTPNEQGIFSTELKYPVTGEDISLIDYVDPYGAIDLDEFDNVIPEERINVTKEEDKEVGDQSTISGKKTLREDIESVAKQTTQKEFDEGPEKTFPDYDENFPSLERGITYKGKYYEYDADGNPPKRFLEELKKDRENNKVKASKVEEKNKVLLASLNKNFKTSMKKSESNGNYSVVNSEGYMGAYQFGNDRLTDYKNATGKNFTKKEFLENKELQDEVFNWHVKDIVKYINNNNLDKYLGIKVKGVTVTLNGLIAMAHLGGRYGMRAYIESGFSDAKDKNGIPLYNKEDSNGTSLFDYLKKFELTD
jgi:hypothetical protein